MYTAAFPTATPTSDILPSALFTVMSCGVGGINEVNISL